MVPWLCLLGLFAYLIGGDMFLDKYETPRWIYFCHFILVFVAIILLIATNPTLNIFPLYSMSGGD